MRRRDRLTTVAGVAIVLLCGMWALWPLPRAEVEPVRVEPPEPAGDDAAPAPLNLAAFDVDLWHVPPQPVAAAEVTEPPPPPAPLRLQLIGILTETGEDGARRLAALYDPDADRLHIVAAGESVGSLTVAAVRTGGVELSDARGSRTLELDRGPKEGTTLADIVRRGS